MPTSHAAYEKTFSFKKLPIDSALAVSSKHARVLSKCVLVFKKLSCLEISIFDSEFEVVPWSSRFFFSYTFLVKNYSLKL